MSRCASAAIAALSFVLSAAGAHAQSQRNFPADALRGTLLFETPPQVLLNGKPARLAPGARVRGQDNLIKMTSALAGGKAVVHYTLDSTGLLQDVWILRDDEAARRPWPSSPDEARAWSFDPVRQAWTRP